MTMVIGRLEFEGPHADFDLLSDQPGVFVLLCQDGDEVQLIDIGESDLLRTHLETHDDREMWQDTAGGQFLIAVAYTADKTAGERRQITEDLFREFAGPSELCA